MDLSSEFDQHQISLAYLPPTPRQTRTALIGVAALVLGLTVIGPFAGTLLPQANGFIPALDAIIFLSDLITSFLFLARTSQSLVRERFWRWLAVISFPR